MKKNHTNLFTPYLFTLSIYEIIYAALFKDYQFFYIFYVFFPITPKIRASDLYVKTDYLILPPVCLQLWNSAPEILKGQFWVPLQ